MKNKIFLISLLSLAGITLLIGVGLTLHIKGVSAASLFSSPPPAPPLPTVTAEMNEVVNSMDSETQIPHSGLGSFTATAGGAFNSTSSIPGDISSFLASNDPENSTNPITPVDCFTVAEQVNQTGTIYNTCFADCEITFPTTNPYTGITSYAVGNEDVPANLQDCSPTGSGSGNGSGSGGGSVGFVCPVGSTQTDDWCEDYPGTAIQDGKQCQQVNDFSISNNGSSTCVETPEPTQCGVDYTDCPPASPLLGVNPTEFWFWGTPGAPPSIDWLDNITDYSNIGGYAPTGPGGSLVPYYNPHPNTGNQITLSNTSGQNSGSLSWVATVDPASAPNQGTFCNVSPNSGTVPLNGTQTITVGVGQPLNQGGLYTCDITFYDPNNVYLPQTIQVWYGVNGTGTQAFNGKCGPAASQSGFPSSVAASNLCTAGMPSSVTQGNPPGYNYATPQYYLWSCNGNGGTNASCYSQMNGSTITGITVSCPATVPINQSGLCTASVQGTGNYSSAVSWGIIGGAQNGPAIMGSIDQSGNYTAPGHAIGITVWAISLQNGSMAMAPIQVVSSSPPTSAFSVACNPSSITVGSSSQCVAIGSSSTINWSVSPGGLGTIGSTSGVYQSSAGAGTVTVQGTLVSTSQIATTTIQIAAALTNSVSLAVSPNPSDTATPVGLTATAGGTNNGTINYSFWWNCSNPTTDVAMAQTACGALPAPNPGSCVTNAVGAKCDAISATTETVVDTYASVGSYTPKVILERGAASAAQDTASLTVNIPSNTHLECVNDACTLVSGLGPNRCATDADCGGGAPGNGATHGVCDAAQQACVNEAGPGASTCGDDPTCSGATQSHLACENDACLIVGGSGINQCASVGSSCAATTITVTVSPSSTVPVGTPITVTASGGTGVYTWQAPGSTGDSISGNGNDTLTGSYPGAGSYTITVTDSNGNTGSVTITVTGSGGGSPTLTVSPSTVVPINTPVTVTASGGTGPYTWQEPGSATSSMSGPGNDTLIDSYPTPGQYNVTVTDSNGKTDSVTITAVNPSGGSVSLAVTPSATVPVGSQVTVTASGGSGLYTWQDPGSSGNSISGSGNNTLNETYSTPGQYTVTVTDSNGANDATTITAIAPNCTFAANPTSVVVPSPSKLTWSCTNAIACTINGNDMSSHESLNGGTLSGSLSVTPSVSTTYTLNCNGGGSSPADSVTLTSAVKVTLPDIIETHPTQ